MISSCETGSQWPFSYSSSLIVLLALFLWQKCTPYANLGKQEGHNPGWVRPAPLFMRFPKWPWQLQGRRMWALLSLRSFQTEVTCLPSLLETASLCRSPEHHNLLSWATQCPRAGMGKQWPESSLPVSVQPSIQEWFSHFRQFFFFFNQKNNILWHYNYMKAKFQCL